MPERAYNHPIQIQENQATQTGLRPADDWVTVLRVFADVTPSTSLENMKLGINIAEVTHVIRMRYWQPLTAKHRVLFRGRALGISAAPQNEGERDRYMWFPAKEEA